LERLFFGLPTPCSSPPPRPSILSNYSFLVYHPVNQDDRYLLWPLISQSHGSFFKENNCFFLLRIKLCTCIEKGT
jgi:hypothetical protein